MKYYKDIARLLFWILWTPKALAKIVRNSVYLETKKHVNPCFEEILQSDWSRTFWAITLEQESLQTWGL